MYLTRTPDSNVGGGEQTKSFPILPSIGAVEKQLKSIIVMIVGCAIGSICEPRGFQIDEDPFGMYLTRTPDSNVGGGEQTKSFPILPSIGAVEKQLKSIIVMIVGCAIGSICEPRGVSRGVGDNGAPLAV
ncbi:hypothetical protein J6590_042042 [Homalodisca vitripennis]|nr:hypothetical protein J6590_042042 [Homalodisca vitripennis]